MDMGKRDGAYDMALANMVPDILLIADTVQTQANRSSVEKSRKLRDHPSLFANHSVSGSLNERHISHATCTCGDFLRAII